MTSGLRIPGAPSDAEPPDPSALLHLSVSPVQLPGSGRGRRSALTALVVLGGAIAAAVVVAQVAPNAVERTPPPVAASAASGVPSPTLPDSLAPAGLPPRVTSAELAQQVRHGTLEGRLVFVEGRLEAIPAPCDVTPARDHACVRLAVGGLALPVNAGAGASAGPGTPSPKAHLVLAVERGQLTYLGSLVASPDAPPTIGELTDQLLEPGLADPPHTLFDMEGYLVVNPVHGCPVPAPDAAPCPDPPPFMAEDEPLEGGMLRSDAGARVDLEPGVVDVDPATTVTAGTFLVTMAPGEPCQAARPAAVCTPEAVRWTVVARYRPDRSVLVAIP
jgi:hypothetical protein